MVTVFPDFTRTVRNFDGLTLENYKVSWDAELPQIPNPVPICYHQMCSFQLQMHKIYFWPGLLGSD